MPAVPITVPGVGESIAEGILARWLKPNGSTVKSGEPLFELETDKASNVVPAPASGVLAIDVNEGETVQIGAAVGSVDPNGTPAVAAASPSTPAASPNGNDGAPASADVALSPAVRRIVAEEKVDVSRVEGTGRDGRVTKGDVLAHLAPAPAAPAPAPVSAPAPVAKAPAPRRFLSLTRVRDRARIVNA